MLSDELYKQLMKYAKWVPSFAGDFDFLCFEEAEEEKIALLKQIIPMTTTSARGYLPSDKEWKCRFGRVLYYHQGDPGWLKVSGETLIRYKDDNVGSILRIFNEFLNRGLVGLTPKTYPTLEEAKKAEY